MNKVMMATGGPSQLTDGAANGSAHAGLCFETPSGFTVIII